MLTTSIVVALLAFAAALVVALCNPAIARCRDILIFEKFFGVHVAVASWIGNTFSPALVFVYARPRRYFSKSLNRNVYPAFLTITIRTRYSDETRILLRLNGISLDSGHLAKWFGTEVDATENGGPIYDVWNPPHLLGKLIGQQVRM